MHPSPSLRVPVGAVATILLLTPVASLPFSTLAPSLPALGANRSQPVPTLAGSTPTGETDRGSTASLPAIDPAPTVGAPMLPARQQLDRSILDDPARTDADRARDPGSKPLDVYEFLGIGPGMTVVDYFPFGGYNTHLLSLVVGSGGKVLGVRTEFFRDQLDERTARAGFGNVELVDDVADLEPGSVDVVLSVRNLHDLYVFLEGVPAEEYAGFLRALKPGGVLGVVDVRTPKEGADAETHRINEELLVGEITAAGFELVERSELLADPDDDHGDSRFPTRYTGIDRMLLKFRKPAGGV